MKSEKINKLKKSIIDACKEFLQKTLGNKKFFYRYISWYCLIVFVFATIYWLIFIHNSTSFIITDQFNKHLNYYFIYDPEYVLEEYHKVKKEYKPFTISEFYESIKPEYEKLYSVTDSLRIKEDQYERCLSQMSHLSEITEDRIAVSIQEYKDSVLLSYQQRIDSLKAYLEGKDSTEMIRLGKYVELSQLKLDYAEKNAEVCSYVVENYGSFMPESERTRIGELNQEIIRLGFENSDLQNSMRESFLRIQEFKESFHVNRCKTVSYWDFLYYSICVSTTVSFGDIAPNNSWSRFVSILELLSCVLLVGKIISFFQRKQEN